ncbi:hypothetical protein HOI71_24345, partial [Candidatus Poribacteria bacterium]|nr:hypothetical protein [Candidatus Poribacteria bacterium]
RKAAERAQKAAEKAAEAAERAATAADDADAQAAVEAAERAAERAAVAAARAEAAARRAGKEATDLNDDGVNGIVDLVLIATAFGATVEMDASITVNDINEDGVIDLLDLVFVAQGIMDGPLLPELLGGVMAAPSQTMPAIGLRTALRPADADGLFHLDVLSDGVSEMQGYYLRLGYDAAAADVVDVTDGALLTDDSSVYSFTPSPETGSVERISADMSDDGVSGSGVLTTVTFRSRGTSWQTDNPLMSARVTLVDRMGRATETILPLRDLDLGRVLAPATSRLLPAYPNPFNPETWIPFELAEASLVTVQVYSSAGSLVRTLDLGYREPGAYADRDDAAYWDGRNELGETSASGVYYYRIQAGGFSDMRRFLLLK